MNIKSKLNKISAYILFSLLFIGCGFGESSGSYAEPDILRCPNAPLVILDNDNFDPDWLVTLVTAIGLDQNCEINLIGVMVNGKDTHDKAGLMYETVLYYYGIQDRVPLATNHTLPMRTTPTKQTADDPHIDPAYKGDQKRITDFESDGILDSDRADVTTVLCKVLKDVPDHSVYYVTGGHLQNIQALLMRYDRECDGYGLVVDKVKEFVFGTGYSKDREGRPEMNFSEGRYDKTAASEAANYVFNSGIDSYVPFVFPHDGLKWSPSYRPGDQYKDQVHVISPMAFVYAIDTYGTWGDHGVGDADIVLSLVKKFQERIASPRRQVCIELNPENAIIHINEEGKCNHYISTLLPEGPSLINQELNALMNQPTNDGKI